MVAIIDFVDSIAASPTTRVNLNDNVTWKVNLAGTDFSPPPLRRTTNANQLSDGDYISASSYGNRTVTLALVLQAADADSIAVALQNLARELDRPNNLLRVQRDGASKPVFFETYRSMTDSITEQLKTLRTAMLRLEAKPFALGLKEVLTPTVIFNDPATGCYLDIPYPSGDVETPLYLKINATDVIAAGRRQTAFAMRRRGTASAAPWIIQAESMTLAASTTLPGNDATASGAGSNYARAATLTSTFTTRLTSAVFPSTASVDARGKYRVYARVRKTASAGEVRVRLAISPDGTTDITPDTVGVVLPTGTVWRWADLGVIQIPIGNDPVVSGPDNTALAARGIIVKLQIALTASASNLDVDCMVFMPADDRMCRVLWPSTSGPTTMVLDSSNRPRVYGLGSSGEVYSTEIAAMDSGTPMISANAYNRMWMLLDTGTTSTAGDLIANTATVTGEYYPRYVYVQRPAAS
jgi:hypothetical protein